MVGDLESTDNADDGEEGRLDEGGSESSDVVVDDDGEESMIQKKGIII